MLCYVGETGVFHDTNHLTCPISVVLSPSEDECAGCLFSVVHDDLRIGLVVGGSRSIYVKCPGIALPIIQRREQPLP